MGCLLAFSMTACTPQPAIAPQKIISTNPCLDAILAEIADPAQIGAVSRWSQDEASASAPLAWARRFPAISDAAEEIILARPRLVLSGNLASSGTNAALAKAGVNVVAFGVPATVAESLAQMRAVALAIGRVEAGERLVKRMGDALLPSRLREGPGVGLSPSIITRIRPPLPPPASGRGAPSALIWQAGGFVAGAGTVQDEMLARAGFRNASAAYGLKQWDVLPLEVLIQSPPDVIFMPVKASGEEGRSIAMRERLTARLKGRTRIVPFPDRLLFCAGPTMVDAMGVMRGALPSRVREGPGEDLFPSITARIDPPLTPPAGGRGI
jgi:iron complex transport system substrate-binding protein